MASSKTGVDKTQAVSMAAAKRRCCSPSVNMREVNSAVEVRVRPMEATKKIWAA